MPAARRAVALAVTAACLLSWWTGLPVAMWRWLDPFRLPSRISLEETVADLSAAFGHGLVAEEKSNDPVTVGRIQPGSIYMVAGADRRAIVAPPPSVVRFRLRVPRAAHLRFGIGVERAPLPTGKAKVAASVRFTVLADGREVFARTLNPAARRDRRWFDQDIDLGVPSERDMTITLRTAAAGVPGSVGGRAGWSHVRVVSRTERERQPASAATPNVLVLLIDTLRADSLGCYGAAPSPSPNLDRLATTGRVFEQAVSQASWTLPAVATFFTGLHPQSHGVAAGRDATVKELTDSYRADPTFLPDSIPTFAARAQLAGITTFGISASPLVSRDTNLTRGFEIFIESGWDPKRDNWMSASELNGAFLRWLARNRRYRFLAYLHYMDVHDPYTPPAALRPPVPAGVRPKVAAGDVGPLALAINRHGRAPLSNAEVAYLRALYGAEITAWDAELARLLDGLAAAGVRDSTVLVVLADHGEEFQEHGKLKHGIHLYDELLRVPLIIAGPGIPPGRTPEQVQGIDIFPTLAALLGIDAPAGLPGQDILGHPATRPALSETRYGIAPDGREARLVSIRTPTRKLISAPDVGAFELFDLDEDPGERRDRFATDPEGPTLAAEVIRLEVALPSPPPATGRDPRLLEKLRTLGYVE